MTRVLVLSEHIRKRPDNYIPDVAARGLHHLAYELVYNAIDDHLTGFCTRIDVNIHHDGSLSVCDDGRGIPAGEHPTEKKSNLEVVLTEFAAGRSKAYTIGFCGTGAKVVAALSEYFHAESCHSGRTYTLELIKGRVTGPVSDIGLAVATGTKMRFWPDTEIFGALTFDPEVLTERLRELAFLNRGLTICFRDEPTGNEETLSYAGGAADYVAWLNKDKETLHLPIHIAEEVDCESGNDGKHRVKVEVALQYTYSQDACIRSYANNHFCPSGGTHMNGFYKAIGRCVSTFARKVCRLENFKPERLDFLEGLTAVINILLPYPQFMGSRRTHLGNPEIESIVNDTVSKALIKYMKENRNDAKVIVNQVKRTCETREAEAQAHRAARNKGNSQG